MYIGNLKHTLCPLNVTRGHCWWGSISKIIQYVKYFLLSFNLNSNPKLNPYSNIYRIFVTLLYHLKVFAWHVNKQEYHWEHWELAFILNFTLRLYRESVGKLFLQVGKGNKKRKLMTEDTKKTRMGEGAWSYLLKKATGLMGNIIVLISNNSYQSLQTWPRLLTVIRLSWFTNLLILLIGNIVFVFYRLSPEITECLKGTIPFYQINFLMYTKMLVFPVQQTFFNCNL